MSSKKCTLQHKQQQVLNLSDTLNKSSPSPLKNSSTLQNATFDSSTTSTLSNASIFNPLAFYRMFSFTALAQQPNIFSSSFQSLLNNCQNNNNSNSNNNTNEMGKNFTLNSNNSNNNNYAAALLQAAALAAAAAQATNTSVNSLKGISAPLFSPLKKEENKQTSFSSSFDRPLKPTINSNSASITSASTNILQQAFNNQLLNCNSFNNENLMNANQLKSFLHQQQIFQVSIVYFKSF